MIKPLFENSTNLIEGYKQHLSQSSSPATTERKMSSLRRFFSWMQKEGKIKENPLDIGESVTARMPVTSSGNVNRQTPHDTGFVAEQRLTKNDKNSQFSFRPLIFASLIVLVILLIFFGRRFLPNNQPITFTPETQVTTFSPWIVKFAGKLTNPQTGAVLEKSANIKFKIWNSEEDGQKLWESKDWNLTPNPEGVFITQLGDTTAGDYLIPSQIFFTQENLFLGVEIEGQETRPRTRLGTAQAAGNSFLLGGYRPEKEAGPETVPVINENGALTLVSPTPQIKALGGNFLLEGQAITIATPQTSDGNITIAPDGFGQLLIRSSTTTQTSFDIRNANLTSGTLIGGTVNNNGTNYNLIELSSGPKPVTRFRVDALGNTLVGGNLNVNNLLNVAGDLQTGGVTRLTATGSATNITGYSQISGNFTITQGASDSAKITKSGAKATTDLLTLTLDERNKPSSIYSTLVLKRFGGAGGDAMALYVDEGNVRLDEQLQLGRFSSNPSAIGQGSVIYNTSDTTLYVWNGTSWVALGGGSTSGFWQRNSGVLAPTTTTDDLAIGGTDSTAPFFVDDATGNVTTAGDVALNGGDLTTTASTFNLVNAATTLNIGSTAVTRTINLGTGTNADTIHIGEGGTNANTITIGTDSVANAITIGTTTASSSLALNDDNWNITGGGAANFVSVGATTAGSGAFTTLTSSGATTLGTGSSLTNTFGSGASSINTIGSTTTPGALTLHGATTLDNTFTVSGTNATSLGGTLAVTGDTTLTGDLAVNGGDLTTTATTFNLVNATATTVNFAGAATTLNIGPTGSGASSIVMSGGSADTGCTLNGATGNLTCSGDIEGGETGTQGFWKRTAGNLYPKNTSDTISATSSATTVATFTSSGTNTALYLRSSGTGTIADLLLIEQTSSGTITDAIDVSDETITNAINVGPNTILGTTADINLDNFDVTGSTGNITTAGDLAVNGGDITTTATTATLFNTTATTLSLGGAATTALNIGNGSGTITNIGNAGGATAFNLTTGTGSQTFTSNVASGTTTTSGFVFDATAITSGTGLYLVTDSVTTGRLLDIATSGNTWTGNGTTNGLINLASSSTAGTGSSSSILLNLARSGANANAAHTAYGLYSAVTNTNATSGTNIAGYFSASGATTANYGLIVENGNVGIGDTSPSALLEVGNGTDSLQISSVGDMTFVDADGSASITGPAGGALSILGGASQALTLTGAAASTWSTSNGLLTISGDDGLTLTASTTAGITGNFPDNITNALDFQQGSDNYININTTNTSENISFGNATTNPSFSFLGTGAVTIAGSADGTDALILTSGDILVSNGDLDLSGGDFNVTLDSGDTVNLTGTQPASVGTTPGTAASDLIGISAATGGNTTIGTTGTGGVGQGLSWTFGTGGTAASANTASTGGAGGVFSLTSGTGGAAAATGTNVGGAGGAISLTGGTGGAASLGTSNTGGAGGAVTILAGSAGSGGNANGGTLTLNSGAVTGTGTSTLNLGTANSTVINVGDSTVTKTIDIGGIDSSAADTINIATNSTAADTIAIGNTNASTTLALTGGDDWSMAATGVLTMSASAAQTTAIVITDTDYTNALSIGDNNITGTTANIDLTYFDVAGSTGAVTIDPQTTGTYLDFTLETAWTSGTLINADFASATTQGAAALTGVSLNLNSNLTTPAAGQNITGYDLQLPTASTTSNATVYTGFNLGTSGAVTNGTAGSFAWRGVNLAMPNITQSAGGSVTSSGVLVTPGTITTAGTQNLFSVAAQSSGPGAGALNALNIGTITTPGAGTETAVNIGSGWDTDINATTSLEIGIGGTNEVTLDGSSLSPSTSDGSALGTTALMWADLFLASGGVINFNNGDVTLTHAADTLTFDGGSTIFNEAGGDFDFRIEGDTATTLFVTDAGLDAVQFTPSGTRASAAGATWDGFSIPASTATITGATNITTATGFNLVNIAQPTLSAASALTVTNSATLYIANAPTGGGVGPAAITNPYALWVDAGNVRLDGTVIYQGTSTYIHTTGGTSNFFAGVSAGNLTTTGTATTGVGYTALTANTSGAHNTALGAYALANNTSGGGNTATGRTALYLNGTGSYNSAFGYDVLYNTTGGENTASGYSALKANTSGNYNTAMGVYSLLQTQTGDYNTAIGERAGQGVANNSFSNNSLFGAFSGQALSTGSNNILLGYKAGDAITTGANNLIIGYDIDAPSATGSNQMSIGNIIFGTTIDGTGTTISTGNIGIGVASPTGRLHIGGNQSASAWGLNGIQLQAAATTYTDTSTAASGTATNAVFNSFAQPTLAATNTSVTTTNAATFYIAAAPTAGTNMTITNPYALWVDGGNVRFDGDLDVQGGDITTTATTFNLINTTATTLNIGGAATTFNVGPTGSGASSIVMSGGSADTGCTLNGATGDLTCSGNITGSSSGTAGFWSRTSTTLSPATTNDVVSISSNDTTNAVLALTSTGASANAFTLTADSTTTGNTQFISADGLTSGTALAIESTATSFNGELLTLSKTGASGSTAFTSDLANITYSQTFNGGVGLNSTGNVLDISRAITLDNLGNTHTISGALVSISDTMTQTTGTLTHTATVLSLTQNYASSTGTVLALSNAGTGMTISVTDDDLIGLGTSAGRLEFDDQTIDEINFLASRVGIGTQTPTSVLHIDQAIETTTATLFARAFIDNTNAITTNTGNTDVYSLQIDEPNITVGTATPTNSASLYISAAATEASNNYALWVDAGTSRFDGPLQLSVPGATGTDYINFAQSGGGTVAIEQHSSGWTSFNVSSARLYFGDDFYYTGAQVFNAVNAGATLGWALSGANWKADSSIGNLFVYGDGTSPAVQATTDARSGGIVTLGITGGAHTAVTAEQNLVDVAAQTLTITGAYTTQRFFEINQPTITAASALTVANAATLYVGGAPVAGGSAAITNNYALWVDAGATQLDGTLAVGGNTTLTGDLAVNGGDITTTATTWNFDVGNGGTINFRDGTNTLVAISDQGTTGRLAVSDSLQVGGLTTIAYSRFGTATATQTGAITASNDILVSGDIELDGNLYLDGLQIAQNDGTVMVILADDAIAGTSDLNSNWRILQTVNTSGSPTALTITGAAHTTLTASTEASDINFNLARTVQFATGALTTQRAVQISAPTYGFVGASTITNAATLYIAAAPTAGTNATITNPYALWVDAGDTRLDGVLQMPLGLVSAPSYTFQGDTNTGMFAGGADDLRLVANGKQRLAVTDSAITIGNTAADTLTVTINGYNSGGGASLITTGDIRVGNSATPSVFFNSYSYSSGDYIRQVAAGRIDIFGGGTDQGNPQFTVINGKVGIRNATPASFLEVSSPAVSGGDETLIISPGAHTAQLAEVSDIVVSAHTNTITGAITTQRFNRFMIPTISAATALTVTNAATLYVEGAPATAGAGPAAITNPYALWVDAGNSRFDADIIGSDGTNNVNVITATGGSSTVFNETGADIDFRIESDTSANMFTLDAGLFSGVGQLSIGAAAQGTATAFMVIDNPALTATANQNFYKMLVDNSAAVTVPTGTAAIVASLAIDEPNITETGTVTDATSLYVQAAPTEGDRNYALWVDSGDVRLDGNVNLLATSGSTVGVIMKGTTRFIHDYGTSNAFMGVNAGNFTTTGGYNVAIGGDTLSANTSGAYNVVSGYQALSNNTSGSSNTALGKFALRYNTTASNNTAIGSDALNSNTTGNDNTAIGLGALTTNTTGSYNVAIGSSALYYNCNTACASNNTAIGYLALRSNGIGAAGNNNTAIGYNSLYAATGANNIALGYNAGDAITSGANNIVIGYDIDAPSATASNQMSIGNFIFATGIDGTGTTISAASLGIGVTAPTSLFQIGGLATTKAAPTTTGAWLGIPAATLTDNSTAASGTAATGTFTAFGIPTYAASNTSVTVTDAANVYIAGAPTAGTNITITNPYALWVDAGTSRFDGPLQLSVPGATGTDYINFAQSGGGTVAIEQHSSGWTSFNVSSARLYFGDDFYYTGAQVFNAVNAGATLGWALSGANWKADSSIGNLFVYGDGTSPAVQATTDARSGGIVTLGITGGAHTAVIAEQNLVDVAAQTLTITGAFAAQDFLEINQPTISAATALTVTTANTMAITGAPTVASSAVITNAYGLQVGGATTIAGAASTTYGAIDIPAHTVTTNTTTQITSSPAAAGMRIGQITVAQSGGAVTVDNAASLYIANAPTAGASVTLTNPYALWVDAGTSRFDGTLQFNGVTTDISTVSNEALTIAPNGTGAVQVTSGATTGTGTSSALSVAANSLTTGVGLQFDTDALTTGQAFAFEQDNRDMLALTDRDLTVGGHTDLITQSNITNAFVYDTSKDMDGGKWTDDDRARSSSWYNETIDNTSSACVLDTDDRCGQRAFPKKALLVVTTTKLYIYDAKDNTLWMDFRKGSGGTEQMIGPTSNSTGSVVFALNGKIYYGNNGSTGGLYAIDFKTDSAKRHNGATTSLAHTTISNRNSTITWRTIIQDRIGDAVITAIHGNYINGKTYIVALGNASIINIIYEDDNRISVRQPVDNNKVAIWLDKNGDLWSLTSDGKLIRQMNVISENTNNTSYDRWSETGTTYNGTLAAGPALWSTATTATASTPNALYLTDGTSTVDGKSPTVYIAHNLGLTVLNTKRDNEYDGSAKYYTNTYITEEMVGDIRTMIPMTETASLTTSGTDIADRSYQLNRLMTNAITTNSITSATGAVRGTGLTLDGTDDYLCADTDNDVSNVCDDNADFDFTGTQNFTIGIWFKHNTISTTEDYLVTKGDGTVQGYKVWMDASGDMCFGVDDDSTWTPDDQACTSGIDYDDNNWHHLAAVKSGQAFIRLYIDGQEVASDTSLASTGTLANAGALNVGADSTPAAGTVWAGSIDELFITAEALTTNQIKKMASVGQAALQNHASTDDRDDDGTTSDADTLQNIFGSTNTVSSVAVDQSNSYIYLGTRESSDGANDGGVSVIGVRSDSRFKTYSIDGAQADDDATTFANDDIVSISLTGAMTPDSTCTTTNCSTRQLGGTLVIGTDADFWAETKDTSFQDFIANSFNPFGETLHQTNLSVSGVFEAKSASKLDLSNQSALLGNVIRLNPNARAAPALNWTSWGRTNNNIIDVAQDNRTILSLNDKDLTIGGHTDRVPSTGIVAAFVYDTTRDPDGGKWTDDDRARGSSWYNEALGVASSRGYTRAFPKTAIIVLSNNTGDDRLYIFDAKDNTMWMQINNGGRFLRNSYIRRALYAYNGKIYVSAALNATTDGGVMVADFINDRLLSWGGTGTCSGQLCEITNNGFTGRGDAANDALYPILKDSVANLSTDGTPRNSLHAQIVNGKSYIAAAADSSVVLINETDQLARQYCDNASDDYNAAWLDKEGNLWALNETTGTLELWKKVVNDSASECAGTPDKTWDEASTPALANTAPTIQASSPQNLFVTDGTSTVDGKSQTVYVGTDQGVTVVNTNRASEADSSVKYITKDWISEEMPGDVRGMWHLTDNAASATVDDVTLKANDLTLYADSDGTPSTTANTSTVTTTSGIRGRGFDLNGSTNFLYRTDDDFNFTTENFTISLWVNPDSFATNSRTLLTFGNNSTTGYDLELTRVSDTAATVTFKTYQAGPASQSTTSTASNIDTDSSGGWYHIAVVRSGTSARIFVNGHDDTASAGTHTDPATAAGSNLVIGAKQSGASQWYDGQIDDVMITAEALNPSQIQTIFNSGHLAGGTGNHAGIDADTDGDGVSDAGTIQQLAGSSNTVRSIAVDSSNSYLIAATNDGSDGGAVSVIGVNSDTREAVYSTDTAQSNKNDDNGMNVLTDDDWLSVSVGGHFKPPLQLIGTGITYAFTEESGGDSQGARLGGTLVIANTAEFFIQTQDISFQDFAKNNYNPFGETLVQNNLNVNYSFAVGTQWLPANSTSSVRSSEMVQNSIFRVDNMGDVILGANSNAANSAANANKSVRLTFNSYDNSATQLLESASLWYDSVNNDIRSSAVITTTAQTYDIAEDFPTRDTTIEAGDVVAVDKEASSLAYLAKSGTPYQNDLIGIVSTNPGFRLSQEDGVLENPVKVALAGRVPVKVSTENGPIEKGDYLTSSSTPGVAMKATKAGVVVGKALEGYSGQGTVDSENNTETCNLKPETCPQGKIMAFVSLGWYDPDIYIADSGQLQITRESENQTAGLSEDQSSSTSGSLVSDSPISPVFRLTDSASKIITRIGAFSEAVVATLRAGLIQTQELVAEKKIVSPVVETTEIKTEGKDLVINLGTRPVGNSSLDYSSTGPVPSAFGKLLVQGNLEITGDATVSGQLTANSVQSREGTFGTIYADEIIARSGTFGDLLAATVSATALVRSDLEPIEEKLSVLNSRLSDLSSSVNQSTSQQTTDNKPLTLEEIEKLLASVEVDQQLMFQASSWNTSVATDSAQLSSNLQALITTNILGNLATVGSLYVGSDLVIGYTLGDTQQVTRNTLDTLAAPMSIQSLAAQPLYIMGDRVQISTNGDVLIKNNLTVEGVLATNTISPVSGDLTIDLGTRPVGNSSLDYSSTDLVPSAYSGFGNLLVKGIGGTTVASIDASGSARFADVESRRAQFRELKTDKLVIAGSATPSASTFGNLLTREIETNATAGQAVIPALTTEITIKSPAVNNNTLVYVTPLSSTLNNVLYVKSKGVGQFTVGFDNPVPVDVQFSWWVIELR